MSYKGRINIYTCDAGHQTITIDTDDGVTPFIIRCRQKHNNGKHNCTEFAKSSFYQADQTLKPEYEWYKPADARGMSRDEKEHFEKGGLSFRKLKI